MTPSSAITVGTATIRQDEHGRFSLNDLHKAAGAEKRHQPSDFLRLDQTQALAREINPEFQSGDSRSAPIWTINGGAARGTYVCRELVLAYGMWVSPAFNLRVIRAFSGQPEVPRTKGEALRLAADLSDRLEEAQRQLAAHAPAIEAHARFMDAGGSLNLRETGKALGLRERDFISRLLAESILYRSPGGHLRAHAEHETAGRFVHRAGSSVDSGHIYMQARVTPEGLTWLSRRFAKAEPQA